MLSFIPFLGFIASLRAAMRVGEGEAGWLTFVAAGAGLLFLALLAGGVFWHHAVFRLDGLDPQISRLLFDLGNFNFANMWVVLGTLVLAVGVVGSQTRDLPKMARLVRDSGGYRVNPGTDILDRHDCVHALRTVLGMAHRRMCGDVPSCQGRTYPHRSRTAINMMVM